MRISRIHCDLPLQADSGLTLEGDSAHYLGTVLRVKPGQVVALFNSRDGEFRAIVTGLGKRQVELQLEEAVACHADPHRPIHLAVGLSRGERMDYLVQKATEIGVSSITPLFTERCEVRLDEKRTDKRVAHWQKVAIAASEQCGRCQIPAVVAPLGFEPWLATQPAGLRLVMDHRRGGTLPASLDPSQAIVVLSGPEGGLSDTELDLAAAAGFQSLTLGPRVLRAETAPVVALSILQYRFGDF